jgi:nucleotide-binding universal stress UspA family protein
MRICRTGLAVYAEVIVAHDGSPAASRALVTGGHLATAWGCPVHVVHVSNEAAVPVFDSGGLPTEVIHADDVTSTLIEVQESRQALLCLASRGRSAVGTALFGSVTADLLRRTHVPMVLTGPGHDPSVDASPAPSRALVCLDGSPTSEVIVPIARQWARELGLHLTFLHVAYPPGERGMDSGAVDDHTAAAIEQVIRHGRSVVDDGMDASWAVVRHTTPAVAILAEAEHHRADLVLMATHGRSGLERVLVGSVTAEVVRRAPMPVVVCRPHGLA